MDSQTHHIIEVPQRNIKRYIPKELGFCDSKEYTDMAFLLYAWQNKQIDYNELAVQATYKLLKLKPGSRKINSLEEEIMYANIAEIAKQCIPTFFDSSGEGDLYPKQNFIKNHIPTLRPIFKKLYGPESRFQNVTFGQYEDALNLFHLYHKHPSKELLYMLMATFYLPKNQEYNSSKVEKLSKKFKYIDFGCVYGFFLFFGSFQIYITSTIVLWEGKKIDFSILFKDNDNDDKSVSNIPGLGFKSIAYQLAESQVFGDLKTLRKENLWEVMLRLYDLRKRDLDNKAEIKEQEEQLKQKNQ